MADKTGLDCSDCGRPADDCECEDDGHCPDCTFAWENCCCPVFEDELP